VTEQTKQLPDAVPGKGASPAGEIRARGAWVEAEVWTERMLTALEQGVLGGKWFSLRDKVYALPHLRCAFARVKANGGAAGVDHVSVREFEQHLEANPGKACGDDSVQNRNTWCGSCPPAARSQSGRRVNQAGRFSGLATPSPSRPWQAGFEPHALRHFAPSEV
jgi:hypothetical protein